MINFKGDLMGFITADWSARVRVSRNGQRRHSTPSGSYTGHIGHLTNSPYILKLLVSSTCGYVCRFLDPFFFSEMFATEHFTVGVLLQNALVLSLTWHAVYKGSYDSLNKLNNTTSYCFTLFICGGPCHLSRFKQCPWDLLSSENSLFIQLWKKEKDLGLFLYLSNILNDKIIINLKKPKKTKTVIYNIKLKTFILNCCPDLKDTKVQCTMRNVVKPL